MSDATGWGATRAALADWRRHAAALGLVLVAVLYTHVVVATPTARYASYLFAFSVWMLWFVLTAVAWIEHAEF